MRDARRWWRIGNRQLVAFMAVALAAIAFSACGGDDQSTAATGSGSGGDAGGETIKWDMMVISGPTGGGGVGDKQKELVDEIAKATNNQLQITLRAPGELPYTMDKLLATVGSGRVQMGDAGVLSAGESKALGIFGLPFLINTPEEYVKAVDALEPTLKKDFDKFGVTQIGYYHWPAQTVWGQGDPISSLRDVDGRRIRASSPEQAYLFEKLGGRPVTLISAEVGQALQRSVIDSLSSSAFNIVPLKWDEDLDWGYMTPLGYVPGLIIVNNDALADLPEDVRAKVDSVMQEWQAEMLDYMEGAEQRDREKLEQNGVELIDGDAAADQQVADDIMAPYWDTWAKDNGQEEGVAAVREALGH